MFEVEVSRIDPFRNLIKALSVIVEATRLSFVKLAIVTRPGNAAFEMFGAGPHSPDPRITFTRWVSVTPRGSIVRPEKLFFWHHVFRALTIA